MTPTWEDIRIWCDELSAWIIALGAEDELKAAHPKAPFPLRPDPEKDDLEDDKDVLGYLTLWMTCKSRTQPPTGLHNRMMLSDPFKGPWQTLYSKILQKMENKEEYKELDVSRMFDLAS